MSLKFLLKCNQFLGTRNVVFFGKKIFFSKWIRPWRSFFLLPQQILRNLERTLERPQQDSGETSYRLRMDPGETQEMSFWSNSTFCEQKGINFSEMPQKKFFGEVIKKRPPGSHPFWKKKFFWPKKTKFYASRNCLNFSRNSRLISRLKL